MREHFGPLDIQKAIFTFDSYKAALLGQNILASPENSIQGNEDEPSKICSHIRSPIFKRSKHKSILSQKGLADRVKRGDEALKNGPSSSLSTVRISIHLVASWC